MPATTFFAVTLRFKSRNHVYLYISSHFFYLIIVFNETINYNEKLFSKNNFVQLSLLTKEKTKQKYARMRDKVNLYPATHRVTFPSREAFFCRNFVPLSSFPPAPLPTPFFLAQERIASVPLECATTTMEETLSLFNPPNAGRTRVPGFRQVFPWLNVAYDLIRFVLIRNNDRVTRDSKARHEYACAT